MRRSFQHDQRRELAARGFTRRDLARIAVLMSAGAALPFYNEAALAQDLNS
jgi:histidinol-phosphate aminotransferase